MAFGVSGGPTGIGIGGGAFPTVDIKLLGDEDLRRAFIRLSAQMQKKIARKALRAGAKVVLKAAKRFAAPLSKRLARFLKLRARKRSRVKIGFNIWTPRREQLGIPEKAAGNWPIAWEMGFKHAKTGQHMPARSYLRRAADEYKDAAFGVIRSVLRREIDLAWSKK
jgi:hypothetical protein